MYPECLACCKCSEKIVSRRVSLLVRFAKVNPFQVQMHVVFAQSLRHCICLSFKLGDNFHKDCLVCTSFKGSVQSRRGKIDG